jgi:hypothetical protein
MKNYLLLIPVLTLFVACTPTINYLGESYSPTGNVEVFYDEQDIPGDFKIMGHLSHDLFISYTPESIQQEMILEAQQRGADAILFSEYTTTTTNDCDSRNMVKASLVKYK